MSFWAGNRPSNLATLVAFFPIQTYMSVTSWVFYSLWLRRAQLTRATYVRLKFKLLLIFILETTDRLKLNKEQRDLACK